MNFIDELYFENINPNEKRFDRNRRHARILELLCKNPIGYWGRLRKAYLCEKNITLYRKLADNGLLWEHLEQMNRQANERYDAIITELKSLGEKNNYLYKSNNQVHIGNIHSIAKEIVYFEIIVK